jgi:DNA-directed RNA polymerase subunit beta'
MSTHKANANNEYWMALKEGQQLPPPKESFVYEKFLNYLKGSGIDVKKDGSKMTLAPLTDKQVERMSSGEIKDGRLYYAKNFKPIKDGLMDQTKLGGLKGEKWGHIDLVEPTLNPVFEKPAKNLLGLGKKFDEIIAGKLFLAADGTLNSEGNGVTGGVAIEKMLKKIDVTKEMESLHKRVLKAKGNQLDAANLKLRYLAALKENEIRPEEAYIRRKVPILPPKYRPVYPMPDGSMASSDINYLYQNTAMYNTLMKHPVMKMLPEDEKAEVRKDVYDHIKGISGLTDLNVKGKERKGFISEIKGGSGGSPKEGMFISRVLTKRQDFTGRGTIIPEPNLGVDEMAMPEEMAWKLFEPFVIRELKGHGLTPIKAKEEIEQRSYLAKKSLDMVMKDRKVLLNRAPSLHKFSVMAFKPQLTDGRAIKIPPLVVSGFNADFDGDTMTAHIPISDEANNEAEAMLPSRNLYQPGTGKLMMKPSQEAQIGLFYLSKTEAGRKKINGIVGSKFKVTTTLNKGQTNKLLSDIAGGVTNNEYGQIISKLKAAGEDHAYEKGFSLGLEDLAIMRVDRDKIVKGTKALAGKTKNQEKLDKISRGSIELVDKLIEKRLKGKNNPLYDMVESGARGSKSQLRQIVATPLFVRDEKEQIVPLPISKSYAEGLDVADYWTSMYGARKGMMDRAISTSVPGEFSKTLMANTIDNVISAADCGTRRGKELDIGNPDALNRYLAESQGTFARNTLVDQHVVSKLKKAGKRKIEVRSPLACLASKGTCSYCYGLDEHGERPGLGENIGAKAGQTLSEPLVQMAMNSFHTGGVAENKDLGGYPRINQILQMPKIMAGAAPLAPIDGKIDKVTPGLAGGYDVQMGKHKLHVPKGRGLKIKQGSKVSQGDPLSDGSIKPQDLVKYKGMRPAQEYMVDELHKAYHGQGARIDRKTFETVVRSFANTTQVLNNPKDSPYLPGDIAPYSVIENHNAAGSASIPVESSLGRKLAKTYKFLRKGHEITDGDIRILQGMGLKVVEVTQEKIKHAPFLKGISTLPLLKKDWMASLGYRNLAKALTEGAGQNWSTDLEGHHPIPAFARGTTFGKGKDGKY